jgi:magnesium transporter
MVYKLVEKIRAHIDTVILRDSTLGATLWQELIELHPADIAQLLTSLDETDFKRLFDALPGELRLEVFTQLSDSFKVYALSFLDDKARGFILSHLSIDDLTEFFDQLSDAELKEYLKFLHKKVRQEVLSVLQFSPESAGGCMDINVLTLMQDFTVEKSIQILQRLKPRKDLHQQIFVTNQDNHLVGYIKLEDLVLNQPKARLTSFLRDVELIARGDQDREEVARNMRHYDVTIVPVVDQENGFLGVITSDTLAEIIVEEAAEDMYRMAALTPIKRSYFETSFLKILFQRSWILLFLLTVQSISSLIMHYYGQILQGFLWIFVPMLTSAGGNTSSQSSALTIQGLANGEIEEASMWRFIKREMFMAACLAAVLSVYTFIRIYITYGYVLGAFVVSAALGSIVMVAVMLGSCMPIILSKLNLDPAHSAGPLLATMMDVIGLVIYCLISSYVLS